MVRKVQFLGGFQLKEKGFFLFLNLLDLITFTIYLIVLFNLAHLDQEQMVISTAIFFCVLAIIVAVMSIIMFFVAKQKFSEILHIFYNWSRAAGHSIVFVLGAYYIFHLLFFEDFNRYSQPSIMRLLLVFVMVASLLFAALNVNWSLTLKKIIHEVGEEEGFAGAAESKQIDGIRSSDVPSELEG